MTLEQRPVSYKEKKQYCFCERRRVYASRVTVAHSKVTHVQVPLDTRVEHSPRLRKIGVRYCNIRDEDYNVRIHSK